MDKTRLIIAILLGLLHSVSYAGMPEVGNSQQLFSQVEAIPGMIEGRVLEKSQIPNPHWRKDACLACHVSKPDGDSSPLKARADHTCFYCHRAEDHVFIHPVNLTPGKKMLAQMPKDFRDNLVMGKKTNCLTCHDVLIQCIKPSAMSRSRNKSFLRGGYYKVRTGVCYRCHNKSAYKKLNPHDQISDKGVLNKDKCLICHRNIPDQGHGSRKPEVSMQVNSDWSQMCLNCHRWQPHPGGNMSMFSGGKPPDHLVVPDEKIRNRLVEMLKKNRLEFPLEPGTGRIYCATCHNPHERGVIKKISLAKGADENKRLRSKRMCVNCHEK